MRTAWTAFESRTAAGTSAAAAVWSAAASAIVAAAVVAIASAAAVRPLEAGAWIAADARGIARKILSRLGSAGARGACFAGKKDAVVFLNRGLGSGFRSGGLDGLVPGFFMDVVIADGSGVQGALMRRIRFGFAERVSVKSACLDSRDFFRAYILGFGFCFAGVNLVVLFGTPFNFLLSLFLGLLLGFFLYF
jgi:hypothetical protein